MKKSIIILSTIFVFCFLGGLPVFGQGIEFANIQTNPSEVHVGDSFQINATIQNNSPDIIYFNGGCLSPLSATFDKNVDIGQAMGCLAIFNANLKPGDNTTIVGPSSGILYTANSSGTTNANITLTYQIGNETESTTKLFAFDISKKATVPEFSFLPIVVFTIAIVSATAVMVSMKNHNLFKL